MDARHGTTKLIVRDREVATLLHVLDLLGKADIQIRRTEGGEDVHKKNAEETGAP